MDTKFMKVYLKKSRFGRIPKHTATIACLGLKKIGSSVIVPVNSTYLGMIKKVSYMVSVEQIDSTVNGDHKYVTIK